MSGFDLETLPTIEGFIETALRAHSMKLRVSMPASVIDYDASTASCTAQPLIKRTTNDGTVKLLPPINKVPVGHLRAGKAIVHVPLAAGHSIYLHFSDRSLDNWKSQGGQATPGDNRLHDLSDAVAYPGVYSFADKLDIADPLALTLMNDQSVIALSADGGIKATNSTGAFEMTSAGKFKMMGASQEVLDLFDQTLAAILAITTNTLWGPEPPNNLATFTALRVKLATLKE